MAGAVAERLLKVALGIDTVAYSVAIGKIRSRHIDFTSALKYRYENEVRCPDSEQREKMKEAILLRRKRRFDWWYYRMCYQSPSGWIG